MSGIKFACCVKAADLKKAEAYGYDYFEIAGKELYQMPDEGYEDLKTMVQSSHIKCCGCNAYCPPQIKIAGPGVDQKKIRLYAEKVIGRAAGLGGKNMGIGSPMSRMLPQDYRYGQAVNELKCFLKMTAEVAVKYGGGVLLEALNPSECNFITSNEEAFEIVEAEQEWSIGIVYDVYHAYMSKEKPEIFNKIFPYVHHIHVCGIAEADRKFLAEDDIDKIRPYMNVVKNSGYEGIISVETGYEFFEPAREALQLLKGEWYED